jgi:ribokinase
MTEQTQTPARPQIAVIGATGVGMVFRVPRQPRPGETLIGGQLHTMSGGKASNHAIGLARLGCQVRLFSALGADSLAEQASAAWPPESVDTSALVIKTDQPSLVGVVLVSDDGENCVVLAPGAMDAYTAADVARHRGHMAGCDLALCSLEMPLEAAREALRAAREHGVTTFLNPAPAHEGSLMTELIALADWITSNRGEAQALTGEADPERAAQVLASMGAGNVVVTLGGDGALLLTDGEVTRIAAPQVAATDTSGAGDAFNAALVAAIGYGATASAAVTWACYAASLVVQAPGFADAMYMWDGIKHIHEVVT